MLSITTLECFDETTLEFIPPQNLELEHSLSSISKWESKWHKPFLSKEKKTVEETLDYIRFMTLTENVDPRHYWGLSQESIEKINAYIDNPMSATIIRQPRGRQGRSETITAETVYSWMLLQSIPIECDKWHFNKLIALINTISKKNAPPKKVDKKKQMDHYEALNEKRRRALKTKG